MVDINHVKIIGVEYKIIAYTTLKYQKNYKGLRNHGCFNAYLLSN